MHHKQAFQGEHRGHCGPMNWGKFGHFQGRHRGAQPPVNIAETDDAYVISLYAAGLAKDQVTLTVKDDVLTIAYPGTGRGTEPTPPDNVTHQEYSQGAFERSFRLNDKVLVDAISARYADGILTVTLPRNPTTNKPAQTIAVA